MKIAQLTSNLHSVSPKSNQAIYSHVGSLTDKLVTLGHEVHLFGAGDSQTKGVLHSVTKGPTMKTDLEPDLRTHYMHLLTSECYAFAPEVDIVHSHFTLMHSFYSRLSKTPTVCSIHSPIRDEIKPLLLRFRENRYISFSLAQRKQMPELNWSANIYHGIDTDVFAYNPHPKDYFLYLGRITETKGVHLAIEAAKAAGVPLLIAGKSYPHEGYWHKLIEREIDGKNVFFVGEANLEKKIELLQGARGVLFPSQCEEAFGLVMIEAMSCGTPVIGWKRGSIPEVIEDRETGYIVNSVDQMVKAIGSIDRISRQATRQRAEKLFSHDKMTSGYLKVYARVIEEHVKEKALVKRKPKSVSMTGVKAVKNPFK